MNPILIKEVYEKMDFLDQINYKQLNTEYSKLPIIKLKNLPKKIKEKLIDKIIIKYSYASLKKEKKEKENNDIFLQKVKDRQLEVIKYIITLGANIHTNDDFPLKYSAFVGHLEIVKFLVEKGANIHNCNERALMYGAKNGHLQIVKYLVESGADIHSEDEIAFRESCIHGHLNVVKYLVSLGVNIHVMNEYALKWSSYYGYSEIANYLVSLGSNKTKRKIFEKERKNNA